MPHRVEEFNEIWDVPGKDSSDSMPVGNGDIGLNVWIEEDADLMIYIGKTDSWDEACRLLKLGRLRIRLDPNPFKKGMPFKQILNLIHGEILIYAGLKEQEAELRIWVDANNPVAHIEFKSRQPVYCEAILETWRTVKRPMVLEDKREGRTTGGSDCAHSEMGLIMAGLKPMVTPDVIITRATGESGSIIWYHRNEASIWYDELCHQGLEAYANQAEDPLLYRTTGGKIWGDCFEVNSGKSIRTRKASGEFRLSICLNTSIKANPNDWVAEVEEISRRVDSIPVEAARNAHYLWWEAFWDRSWIKVGCGDPKEAEAINKGWHLHRFTVACAGRGNFPLKFNGSIFNVDGNHDVCNRYCHQGYDADFRAWGGCYWFQNQRQIYWPMLAAGDFDCMLPFFKMYLDALPFAKAMTSTWFKHEGAFFPETMYFWGSYNRTDYGLKPARERQDIPVPDSGYVRYYWQGGLELVCMMLEYYLHTEDTSFFREILLPVASEVITFYNRHYQRDANGKIRFEPAQALETYWDVVNPMPEIAGLKRALELLIACSNGLVEENLTAEWKKLLDELPPLPVNVKDGKEYLEVCEENRSESHNIENIALYAVFPYRLFGVGKKGLDIARNTYDMRAFRIVDKCWCNDRVFAAYLGLVDEAKNKLAERFTLHEGYRFPAFYGPDMDWVPDHDNGGVAQQTLQGMLMQADGKEIPLFPAWPSDWDVEFKLHAPFNTTVEAKLKSGKIEYLKVFPEERLNDLKVLGNFSY